MPASISKNVVGKPSRSSKGLCRSTSSASTGLRRPGFSTLYSPGLGAQVPIIFAAFLVRDRELDSCAVQIPKKRDCVEINLKLLDLWIKLHRSF